MPYMLDKFTMAHASVLGIQEEPHRDWNPGALHKAGRPLSEEEVSRFACRFEFETPVRSLKELDFILFSDAEYLVSSRVIKILQDLEPGIHQILPFYPYKPPEFVETANLSFGLINCCKREDFIDIERSGLVARTFSTETYYSNMSTRPLYAKRGWRPSGHLWRSVKKVLDSGDFVSEALRERLLDLGVEPSKFVEVHLT